MMKRAHETVGFTLIELILVVGIFSLVFISSGVVFGNLIQKNSLDYHGYQLVQNLREARMNAVTQWRDSACGLYFDTSALPHGYTVFKGNSFAGRDAAYDLSFELPEAVAISQLDPGGFNELVFGKSDGLPSVFGGLVLAAEDKTFSITVNSLGLADFDS